jgi:hypothetical protein
MCATKKISEIRTCRISELHLPFAGSFTVAFFLFVVLNMARILQHAGRNTGEKRDHEILLLRVCRYLSCPYVNSCLISVQKRQYIENCVLLCFVRERRVGSVSLRIRYS